MPYVPKMSLFTNVRLELTRVVLPSKKKRGGKENLALSRVFLRPTMVVVSGLGGAKVRTATEEGAKGKEEERKNGPKTKRNKE